MKGFSLSRSSIQNVRSGKTRDLLRGLLDKNRDSNTRATFLNLAKGVEAIDLAHVDSLLRDNPLFAHVPLSAEFPTEDDLFVDSGALVFSPPASLRTDYIVIRANAHADTIANALEALVRVNESVFLYDDDTIIADFEHVIGMYGHSLALARKLAFVLGHRERDTDSWKMAARAFASYGLNARNYGMMAVADSIGFEFSYLDVKSSFENFADYKRASSISQKVSYLSFKPLFVCYRGSSRKYHIELSAEPR